MNNIKIQKIVILGDDVTCWAVAASLAQALQKTDIQILVIKHVNTYSNSVEDAESLLPQTQLFHEQLGIKEETILAYNNGSFSLGNQYYQWGNRANCFSQGFNRYGVDLNEIDFHHFFIKFKKLFNQQPYESFSLAASAAKKGKFTHPVADKNSILSTLTYGLNLSSIDYAKHLKEYALTKGVTLIGAESEVNLFSNVKIENNAIDSITLKDNKIIKADFFIDCTGTDSLLLGDALKIKNTDWSCYYPSNRKLIITTSPHQTPIQVI